MSWSRCATVRRARLVGRVLRRLQQEAGEAAERRKRLKKEMEASGVDGRLLCHWMDVTDEPQFVCGGAAGRIHPCEPYEVRVPMHEGYIAPARPGGRGRRR